MGRSHRYRNLLAVPSYHYHPVFACDVRRALRSFRPSAIALEIPPGYAAEFAWGAGLWPSPVVSFGGGVFLPIVPGDSMVEACRLGNQAGIPVFLVDLDVAGPIERPDAAALPDPALASRVGNLFLETTDALAAAGGPPADGDLAREAHMAAELAALMGRFDRVLWVGGMAHWSRIRRRLAARDFAAPAVQQAELPRTFERMRLEWSALHRMTGRLPFQVHEYARRSAGYTESQCLRKLALAAIAPEKFEAIEVAALLVYARNLAAHSPGIQETPGLWELLTAASSVLGSEYASRLATVALKDRHEAAVEAFPPLTWAVERSGDERVGVYRCEGRVLAARPLFGDVESPRLYRLPPSSSEIERRRRNNPAREVATAAPGERTAWVAYPDDETSYEGFVRYVLERAAHTAADSAELTPAAFQSGLGEGLDIRATMRHWHEGQIYVRERARAAVRVTNGLIDFTGTSEASRASPPSGRREHGTSPGWIDPDLTHVGSASRETRLPLTLQEEPFLEQLRYRELSIITLDAPTWVKSKQRRSFFDQVIMPLVRLDRRDDDLYGWLRIAFGFCRNKPFAYCSRYKPGPRIHAIAREFGVRLIHVPLKRIPDRMLERHRTFRFMNLTRPQWDELQERIAESRRAWTAEGVRAEQPGEPGS